ncbi:head maturation protease, ClpP-related [Sinomonas sp. ASV322]|uniref:head maturation protease, ClpP-related n=1 Tax=Sinomonas sp. ASV322 TaxID=3041920 RepID=UPI0027DCA735|nr:head maturation protease, ClpP-related [Sinomonas sp. ASV322]MDQ4502175.1 Clp protease ClpP [Sinomonas sp. ASV322]
MAESRYRFRGNIAPAPGIRASVLEPETDGQAATLRLYDPIDSWGEYWGVSAKEFAQSLASLPPDTEEIRLHINSPGGEVHEAIAILNQLRGHRAKVVAYVDGLAASAASFIAAGADELVMGRNSQLMVHDAWGLVVGNAGDMHAMADTLDKISDNIASVYAAKAGDTTEAWRDVMRAETWMNAEEAVAAGLADRVDEPAVDTAPANRFDLSMFAHAGREHAPDPAAILPRRPQLARAAAATRPPAEPVGTTPNKEGSDHMPEALIKGLRDRLGIPAGTELDDDGILSAVDEALAERAAPAPAEPAAGTVVLDAAQYEELRNDAADGRAAQAQQLEDQRRLLVEAAVRDGRIPPARRSHWLDALLADPGAADTLAGLAKGLIPLEARGITGGVDESSDEDAHDALYSKFYPAEEARP